MKQLDFKKLAEECSRKISQTKEDASNSSISRLFSYRGKDITEAPPIISQKDVVNLLLLTW